MAVEVMKSPVGNVARSSTRTMLQPPQQVLFHGGNSQQPVASRNNYSFVGLSSAPTRASIQLSGDFDGIIPAPTNAIDQDARGELDAAEVSALWTVPRVTTVIDLPKFRRHRKPPISPINSLVAEDGETGSKE